MLKVIEDGAILRIELSRPDVRNAFNPALIAQISEAFLLPIKKKQIRMVVLTGEGKAFCAGADLNWMQEMAKYTTAENEADALKLFEMFERISDCPIPVVALVKGAAFGGALGLIAASDYVISAADTQFCFSEVKLGIAPAVISSFVLNKVESAKVAPYMISGKTFNASEAHHLGLVHEVVQSADLNEAQNRMEKLFCEAGPEAVKATKKLVRKLKGLSWEQQRLETSQLIAELRAGAEGREGIGAFLQKRAPSWRLN